MKKINKMNINGEVYDIQDNSSGFPKVYLFDRLNYYSEENAKICEEIYNRLDEDYVVKTKSEGIPLSTSRRGAMGVEFSLSINTSINDTRFYCNYYEFLYNNNTKKVTIQTQKDIILPLKSYVDSKFAEALAMGFKAEVVEALPTENISHQTIYLMLSSSQAEGNIYDEYIYTSDNEWEKIGSTSTSFDLSNYYNKEEVEELVAPIQGYEIIPIDCGEYGNDETKRQRALENASYLINKLYEDLNAVEIRGERKKIYVPLVTYHNTYYTSCYLAGTINSNLRQGQLTTIKFKGSYNAVFPLGVNQNNFNTANSFTIIGVWNENVFTATNVSSSVDGSQSVIGTSNSTKYFPRSDYHPVTRKYIDETNIYDWNTNNIVIWASYQNYVVGQIVYQTDNLKYYKCLEDHKSAYQFSNDTSKWQELTEEVLETMKRPTKEYVDNAVANAGGGGEDKITHINFKTSSNDSNYDSTDDIAKEKFSKLITDSYKNDKLLCFVSGDGLYRPKTNYSAVQMKSLKTFSYVRDVANSYSSSDTNGYTRYCNVFGEWNGDVFVCTKASHYYLRTESEDNYKFIPINNTKEYTPTSDYNPATKKYVDDAIVNVDSVFISKKIYTPYKTDKQETIAVTNEEQNKLLEILQKAYNDTENVVTPFDLYINIGNLYTGFRFELTNEHLRIGGYPTLYRYYSEAGVDGVVYLYLRPTITDNAITSTTVTLQVTWKQKTNKTYVDTAISTALGDVNSILATLTTVEEGE